MNRTDMNQNTKQPLFAHLSLLGAATFWGLMAPLGKDAMNNGINGVALVMFRILGGATLFWLASLFVQKENVCRKDIFLFMLAAVLGLICNQCCYTIGLSLTSPINAGIITTTMPIFALILSALILKEPITPKKAIGVALGFSGAVLLISTSLRMSGASGVGSIKGDLLCLGAQLSYTLYLTIFNKLVKRYSAFTINKWMFLWATLLLFPFAFPSVQAISFSQISLKTYLEVGYVVVFGTFICYLLMISGQRVLRPTVVSMYNYMQPVVATIVSVSLGLAALTFNHFIAVVLIFIGVWLVVRSKSKRDISSSR